MIPKTRPGLRRNHRNSLPESVSLQIGSAKGGNTRPYGARLVELSSDGLRCAGFLPSIPPGTSVTVTLRLPSWFGTRRLRLPSVLAHQEEGSKSSPVQPQWVLLFTAYEEATMKRLNNYLYRVQKSQQQLGADLVAQSNLSESLRMLQVSLGPPLAGTARVILVTSSMVGEGRTFISSRLAVLLAQEGHRVLLVDADLRRPSLHRVFQVPLAPGLAQFRAAGPGPTLSELILETGAGIALVPGGDVGPGSSEVWARISPPALFRRLKESPYSYVIMDSPPLLVAAETSLLAARADDVVLVVRAGSTREHAVRQSQVLLERNHAKLRGIVLNDQADYLQPTYMKESQPYRGAGKVSARYIKEEEEVSPLNPASENS